VITQSIRKKVEPRVGGDHSSVPSSIEGGGMNPCVTAASVRACFAAWG